MIFWAAIGHGRALEAYLGLMKIVLAAYFILTVGAFRIPAIADLAWQYPRPVLGLPFFIIGATQIYGVVLNTRGVEFSWTLRAGSAAAAIFLWLWIIIKTISTGEDSVLAAIAVPSILASIFLFGRAWNRLPVPGAPGLL